MSHQRVERDELTPRNAMKEHNPETWDPDPSAFESGETGVWDPIRGESFSEPGHWADRDPDMDREHARRLALRGEFDDADHLPLIASDMRGVPTEGVQGSYTRVIRRDTACPECDQHYATHARDTMPGIGVIRCLLCDTVIDRY